MIQIPEITRECLVFEEFTWATGSVLEDPFYSVGEDTASAAPGTLLKVERTTNTTLYSIPPSTALSRIVYQSKRLRGSLVPVSAYILWPQSARPAKDGHQVVAWAHNTVGVEPNCAPSHLKTLWQHFLGPYQLALQGYVVVATDYAGLGVSQTAKGEPILHEYLTCPSHANDVLYSIQAAQAAFPELSSSFVVVGHSQGGGAAWSVAEQQAVNPTPGYLGAVALSPFTNVTAELDPYLSIIGTAIAASVEAVFPDFEFSDILTPAGVNKLNLLTKLGGNVPTALTVLTGAELTKPDWVENQYVKQWQALVANGGKPIGGPMIVIHGDQDVHADISVLEEALQRTTKRFPEAAIEYYRVPGGTNKHSLTSTQWIWMDWIAKRFAGVKEERGLKEHKLKLTMPITSYQSELNWHIVPATNFYETP